MRQRKHHVSFVIHAQHKDTNLHSLCTMLEELGLKRDIDFQATRLPKTRDNFYTCITTTVANENYDPARPISAHNQKTKETYVFHDVPNPRYNPNKPESERNKKTKSVPQETITSIDIPITFAVVHREGTNYEFPRRLIRGYALAQQYIKENAEAIRKAFQSNKLSN